MGRRVSCIEFASFCHVVKRFYVVNGEAKTVPLRVSSSSTHFTQIRPGRGVLRGVGLRHVDEGQRGGGALCAS